MKRRQAALQVTQPGIKRAAPTSETLVSFPIYFYGVTRLSAD
jgi:hypothetical protein